MLAYTGLTLVGLKAAKTISSLAMDLAVYAKIFFFSSETKSEQ